MTEHVTLDDRLMGGTQNDVEEILRDLCWARMDKNGMPYIDSIPQAAKAVISYMNQYYTKQDTLPPNTFLVTDDEATRERCAIAIERAALNRSNFSGRKVNNTREFSNIMVEAVLSALREGA